MRGAAVAILCQAAEAYSVYVLDFPGKNRRGSGLSRAQGLREHTTWAILESSVVGPEKSLRLPRTHAGGQVLAVIREKVRVLGRHGGPGAVGAGWEEV